MLFSPRLFYRQLKLFFQESLKNIVTLIQICSFLVPCITTLKNGATLAILSLSGKIAVGIERLKMNIHDLFNNSKTFYDNIKINFIIPFAFDYFLRHRKHLSIHLLIVSVQMPHFHICEDTKQSFYLIFKFFTLRLVLSQ